VGAVSKAQSASSGACRRLLQCGAATPAVQGADGLRQIRDARLRGKQVEFWAVQRGTKDAMVEKMRCYLTIDAASFCFLLFREVSLLLLPLLLLLLGPGCHRNHRRSAE
jgi:hypothetical protein